MSNLPHMSSCKCPKCKPLNLDSIPVVDSAHKHSRLNRNTILIPVGLSQDETEDEYGDKCFDWFVWCTSLDTKKPTTLAEKIPYMLVDLDTWNCLDVVE